MAKVSGITTSVTVDNAAGAGQNISADIFSFDVSTPRGTQDITGLDKSAVERLLLLADGTISITGGFNTAANMSHAVLSTVPTQGSGTGSTRTVVIVYPGPATLTVELVLTDYALSRAQDGSLTWTCPGSLANGVAPTWS